MRDRERVERIQQALTESALDAVVCALPAYVLLLSGYWPVVGTSLCVATRDGHRVLLAPEDEQDLARHGQADDVRLYKPSSLERIQSVGEAAAPELRKILRDLKLNCARVGYELGAASEPASYSAMHLFGGSIVHLLREAAPANALAPADAMLARLAAVKTQYEVDRIRTACQIAAEGFSRGRAGLRPDMEETAAAEIFRAAMSVEGAAHRDVRREVAFAWCMSGENSALASGAYARSRDRRIGRHELVLVHCNSSADGYWTDITRTYVLGTAQDRQIGLYEAVFAARASALAAIRPGARACEVDRAARDVFRSRGLADAFRHSTGHGVGFASISANALPRIHPKSEELLETGMVFNIEPAAYLEGYGGLRHCDMVAVTDNGVEVLTPFQTSREELLVQSSREAA